MNSEIYYGRRQGPDFWVKFVKWVGICSWFILFIIVTIITKAQPQVENFMHKVAQAHLRKTWNMELIQISYYLMLFLFFIAISAFIANTRRLKRATDRLNISVIIMLILSTIGLILLGVNF